MKSMVKRGVLLYLLCFSLCIFLCGCGSAQTAGAKAQGAETEGVQEEEVKEVAEAEPEETAEEKNAPSGEKDADTASEKEGADAVPENLLEEVTEQVALFEEPKTMYATNAVNVRRGPSTDYEIIGHLAFSQQVEATGQAQTKWYQVVFGEETAYVSNRYLSETVPELQTAEENQAAGQGTEPEETAGKTSGETSAVAAPAGVVMVGDSRCVQMQAAVEGGGCTWICENSKEYTWFVEKAIPRIDGCVGQGTKIVINMGVNDPEHYKQYAETINAKAAEWAQSGATTYLVSVNPVWENPYTTQEQVDMFNSNIPGLLSGVTWIDTSSSLVANGYRILDGLHYDDPTYVNIFNLIMGSIS